MMHACVGLRRSALGPDDAAHARRIRGEDLEGVELGERVLTRDRGIGDDHEEKRDPDPDEQRLESGEDGVAARPGT